MSVFFFKILNIMFALINPCRSKELGHYAKFEGDIC